MPTTILAIESSCDETAVAVIRGGEKSCQAEIPDYELLASKISSQIPLHRQYGGVVPEVASRNHSAILPKLIAQTLEGSGVQLADIDAFAATSGPGLASSLLIGHTMAKTLALALNKPFLGINHLEGHLISPYFSRGEVPAHLALVVSGGHTLLLDVKEFGDYQLLGRTLDDAAGEAFDKVAKMLGLPYPGGPEVDARARNGNPKAFNFPRALLREATCDFSFSGLKTAVLYELPKLMPQEIYAGDITKKPIEIFKEQEINDLCASFQQAVVDSLIRKTRFALEKSCQSRLAVSGGVSNNSCLREAAMQLSKNYDVTLTPAFLTTDNAAMIAAVAWQKFHRGQFSSFDEDIDPNFPLAGLPNRTKNRAVKS